MNPWRWEFDPPLYFILSVLLDRGYIIKQYLLERWSLIFPDHHDFSRRLRTWLTSEAVGPTGEDGRSPSRKPSVSWRVDTS